MEILLNSCSRLTSPAYCRSILTSKTAHNLHIITKRWNQVERHQDGSIKFTKSEAYIDNKATKAFYGYYNTLPLTHYALSSVIQQQQKINSILTVAKPTIGASPLLANRIRVQQFHAANSKIKYLDFRYRVKTHHTRLHLIIIKRQKMKKHQRRKFRRKFKCLLAKQRLKREIAKEKAFRVELLTMIRRAETFDPKDYAIRKLAEKYNKPREFTAEEKREQLKELIRVNRFETDYIKPKHRRADQV